jgi:hypothetical protein
MGSEGRLLHVKNSKGSKQAVISRSTLGQLLEMKQYCDDKLKEYQKIENDHLSELFCMKQEKQLLEDRGRDAPAKDPLSQLSLLSKKMSMKYHSVEINATKRLP